MNGSLLVLSTAVAGDVADTPCRCQSVWLATLTWACPRRWTPGSRWRTPRPPQTPRPQPGGKGQAGRWGEACKPERERQNCCRGSTAAFWSGCASCPTAFWPTQAHAAHRLVVVTLTQPAVLPHLLVGLRLVHHRLLRVDDKAGHLVGHHAVHQAAGQGRARQGGVMLRSGRNTYNATANKGAACTANRAQPLQCGVAAITPATHAPVNDTSRAGSQLLLTCSRRPRRSWPARAPPRCSCGLHGSQAPVKSSASEMLHVAFQHGGASMQQVPPS